MLKNIKQAPKYGFRTVSYRRRMHVCLSILTMGFIGCGAEAVGAGQGAAATPLGAIISVRGSEPAPTRLSPANLKMMPESSTVTFDLPSLPESRNVWVRPVAETAGSAGSIVRSACSEMNGFASYVLSFEGMPDGFYALEAGSIDAVDVLGTFQVRHRGAGFTFIPSASVCTNYAYPPEIASWSSEDKALQRTDGAQLVQRVLSEISSGANEIIISAGNYRVGDSKQAVFSLTNVHNLTIDGGGAVFWLTDMASRLFDLNGCSNVLLKNFTVDYDPLPYVQGTVSRVVTTAPACLEFVLDPGFEGAMQKYQSFSPKKTGQIHIFTADDSAGLPLAPLWIAGHDKSLPIEYDATTRKARVQLAVREESRAQPGWGIAAGDLVALTPRYYGKSPLYMTACSDVKLLNVHLFGGGRFGVESIVSRGLELDGCRLVRRPNTRRLVSSNMDGFHLRNNVVGPRLFQCVVEASMDDAIAMPGMNAFVLRQKSPQELIVATRSKDVDINAEVGSRYEFFTGTEFVKEGEAIVTAIEEAPGEKSALPPGLPFSWIAELMDALRPYCITLDRPVEVAANSYAISDLWQASGFEITDCYIRNNWALGIRATGVGGRISDCIFDYTQGIGMRLDNRWLIGSVISNLSISGNVFYKVRPDSPSNIPICVTLNPRDGVSVPVFDCVNIMNNQIIDAPYAGIFVSDTTHLNITGNQFMKTTLKNNDPFPEMNTVIVLSNCPEAVLDANNFVDASSFSTNNVSIEE
ncbi:MAG: right-handed parallel beta-helix repeat-containing protein [Kiritimatiellales bacterium]